MSVARDDLWPRSIGVIGLGIMGSAVARHLAAAGREVIGFDIDAARAEIVAGPRFRKAASAAAAAEEADLLLTSLPAEIRSWQWSTLFSEPVGARARRS